MSSTSPRMSSRSLRVAPDQINAVKSALKRNRFSSQQQLADNIETGRSTINNFVNGKPVDSCYFFKICDTLGLDWETIANPEVNSAVETQQISQSKQLERESSIDIDALVREVREKVNCIIQERCGEMRALDMTKPIGLKDIYTNVNILEKIPGRRRKEIAEFQQECKLEDFDRFGLGRITEERVSGLNAVEKYTKLIILGKPGAGKTTFLKYVAIQCNGGEFQAEFVPIFVTLKDFAETSNKAGLLEYIIQQLSCSEVTNTEIASVLNKGKALVLLDGLDEVKEEDSNYVLKEIRNFSDVFSKNHFVMTCRIAAKEYTFDKFSEVEIADFDDEQISTFAHNWFKNKDVKPETFLNRLEDKSRIKQLATNPLLLLLLCLAFEESGDFPVSRSELYKDGLDALLKKWDAKRAIYRDQVYKNLTPKRKKYLLRKIALTTFENGDYFFKQKVVEQYIKDYILNLPSVNTDEEALQVDSETILRSIEAQHGLLIERAKGIYSFSHLTFHEYFTAREIVLGAQLVEEALPKLVSHITEKHWREVFLLAVEMSPSADRLLLLMKKQVDQLLATDEKLQEFLIWVSKESHSLNAPCKYKLAAVRAFYLDIDIDLDPDRMLGCLLDLPCTCLLTCVSFLARALKLDLSLVLHDFDFEVGFNHTLEPPLAIALERVLAIDHYLKVNLDPEPELKQALQQLKEQFPERNGNDVYEKILRDWCKTNGQAWADRVKEVIVSYKRLGENWKFTEHQKQLLKQYYDANLLLVLCLNSDCDLSRNVRSQITDNLLLPMAEIKH